jgi:hypothetical protein
VYIPLVPNYLAGDILIIEESAIVPEWKFHSLQGNFIRYQRDGKDNYHALIIIYSRFLPTSLSFFLVDMRCYCDR